MSRPSPFQRLMSALATIAIVAGVVRMTPISVPVADAANGDNATYELSVDSSNNPASTVTAAVETRTVSVGQTFPVNVLVNTDGASFNAGTFEINWNAADFDITTPAGAVIPSGLYVVPASDEPAHEGTTEVLLQGSSIFGSGYTFTVNQTAGTAIVSYGSTPSNTDPQIYSPTDTAATVNPNGAFPGTDRLVTVYFEANQAVTPAVGTDNIYFSETTGFNNASDNKITHYGDWMNLGTPTQGDFYIHTGATNVVAVGDKRLTLVGMYSSVTTGNGDISDVLVASAAAEPILFTNPGNNGNDYDTGDSVYVDMDNSGTVTTNDIRVTAVGTSYAPTTTVAATDTDATGSPAQILLFAFDVATPAKLVDTDADGYDAGEIVYIDMDNEGTVTVADIRLSDLYGPMSDVVAGDIDVGTDLNPGSASDVRFRDDDADGVRDPMEGVYQNLDYPNTTVSAGDLRMYTITGRAEGSALGAADADISALPFVRLANVRQSGTGGSGENILNLTDGVAVTATAVVADTFVVDRTCAISNNGGTNGTATFTITTTPGATVGLSASPGTPVISPGPTVVANASGVATFTAVSVQNSTSPVTFTATVNTVALAQTRQVTFQTSCSPGIDAAQSRIDANPTACVATGSTTTAVTVSLRNTDGTPFTTSTTVTLNTGSATGLTITPATATTTNGTATFTVASSVAQTVTFSALATPSGGSAVSITTPSATGGNVVTFAASCATVPTSLTLISPTCVTANGTAQTLTYEVRNGSSATVTGAAIGAITVGTPNSPAVTVGTPSTPTSSTGQFTVSVTAPSNTTGSRTFSVPVTVGSTATTLQGTIPVCAAAAGPTVTFAPACIQNNGTSVTLTGTVMNGTAPMANTVVTLGTSNPLGITYPSNFSATTSATGTFTLPITAATTATIGMRSIVILIGAQNTTASASIYVSPDASCLTPSTKEATGDDQLKKPGDVVTYTVDIRNNGAVALTDVTMTDIYSSAFVPMTSTSTVTVPTTDTNLVITKGATLDIRNIDVAAATGTTTVTPGQTSISYPLTLKDQAGILTAFGLKGTETFADPIFYATAADSTTTGQSSPGMVGKPDNTAVSLGGSATTLSGSTLTLAQLQAATIGGAYVEFGRDGDLGIVNGNGTTDDLRIYEIDGTNDTDSSKESYAVYAWDEETRTFLLLSDANADGAFDLGSLKWTRLILIVDTTTTTNATGTMKGADIDAVQVLSLGAIAINTVTLTSTTLDNPATTPANEGRVTLTEFIAIDLSNVFTPGGMTAQLDSGNPCYRTGRDATQGGRLILTLRSASGALLPNTAVVISVAPNGTVQIGGKDVTTAQTYTTDANGKLDLHFTSQTAQDPVVTFTVNGQAVYTFTGRFRVSCELPRTGMGTTAALLLVAALPAAVLTRRRLVAAARTSTSN